MLYSAVAAFLMFLSIVLPPLFASKSTDKTGFVAFFYLSMAIFVCALFFDLVAFFAKYPARYSLIVASVSLLSLLLVAMFAPKTFFDSWFYAIFISISIVMELVALATLFYKLIQRLIKLLQ